MRVKRKRSSKQFKLEALEIPTFDVSRGRQAILHAMEAEGVRRLFISTGAGVGDPGDASRLFNRLMNALVEMAAGNVYTDRLPTVELVRAGRAMTPRLGG